MTAKTQLTRRGFIGASAALTALIATGAPVLAQSADSLTIAYNIPVQSWDPTTGPAAVNPALQSIYLAVFDRFIDQAPDLSFGPGLLTEWGFNDDKTKITMTVREGVKWHNGDDFTPEDVVWSLTRAANPATGNPMQFVWSKIGNFSVEGNVITGDVFSFEPALFKWMAFLTAFVLPKKYYEEVGSDGFEKAPIGTGPYMVDAYEQGAYVRLKAFADYWGGAPEFDTVTIKFVTDAASRVAEIESGNVDVTSNMPYEEYDRLIAKDGLSGVAVPITDIGMIFLNDIDVMLDKNVRLAAHHAIDKQLIIDRLLRGYGVALSTLEVPGYAAYDDSIVVEYDPEKSKELLAASGYSTDNPVTFTIQTTRGFKPKDYEMIQAIVGMWRKVGINAEIEVYEIAKHYELRASDTLAPAAFYNWGNSIGDPSTSTGFSMFGPSPHAVWDSPDLVEKIGPLFVEPDEDKRIQGYKDVSRYIAEEGYVIPILQYVMPIVYASTVNVVPYTSGDLLPQAMTKA
ncbi:MULTISPECIES: ABC transporter substrate-binding protein [Roseobacteraceae]|uniref:Peptide ABC transporter substrate-binding protein n=1 Tax=Celeribacter baekdonensis B30 TaxID=1208323 RepID=K2JIA9_9RHOB|nr:MULTISPECIES: ABC transporter substrate-binding protein [Roseobacteraceae]EKE70379.1 peptide ABC transporter substrate-binding protein [Celeribacter baekdonensis B30]KAB6717416.1 peptide ABC transporter substrate-binding protein [Roseobacter sp. TSBP12]